jgi:hypothetical protein
MTIKRAAALLLAASLMAAAFVGCTFGENTGVAATYSGGEIPAGIYIYHQITALNEAALLTPDPAVDLLKQQIEGTDAEQWINERAVFYTKRFAAIEAECLRLGITADETALAPTLQAIDSAWESEGALLEEMGVSRSSVELAIRNNQKMQQLFLAYYGEGGEQEIPESQLLSYYSENYRRMLALVIPKYDETTYQPLSGDALAERQEEINDYLARAQAGEPLFSLIVEQDEAMHAGGAEHTHGELVEAEQEAVISRQNTTYPAEFIDRLFEGDALNTPELYEDESLALVFERRELLGENDSLGMLRDGLAAAIKGDAFDEELAGMADSIGFVLNDAAVKRFKVSRLSAA